MNSTTIIFLLTLITVVFIAWDLYLAFENDKLEKQSKTDSGIIAKNIMRIINQGIDIELLKDQLKHEKHNKQACNTCNVERVELVSNLRKQIASQKRTIKRLENNANKRRGIYIKLFSQINDLETRLAKFDRKRVNGKFIKSNP